MLTASQPATTALTPDQLRIVEWGDGPLVVIAGAGTGKTKVIVERVSWLLETRGALAQTDDPLLPEHLLVLTYNMKAAKELQTRIDEAVGVATRSRMTVTNFHSFCQRFLTENAADAGLPPHPDVLDGIGQVLLLKDIRPRLHLVYHSDWWLGSFVPFISRAEDELVTPDDFDAYVDEERRTFEARYGSYEVAAARLEVQGNLKPLRDVRGAYAGIRNNERAEARGETPDYKPDAATKVADREARRTIAGTGYAQARGKFAANQHLQIDALAATYVVDGAALEVLRLTELAAVYRAYEAELARRGALDFGEQIAAVSKLFKRAPTSCAALTGTKPTTSMPTTTSSDRSPPVRCVMPLRIRPNLTHRCLPGARRHLSLPTNTGGTIARHRPRVFAWERVRRQPVLVRLPGAIPLALRAAR